MKDVLVGDAVCSDPNSPRGWFVVDDVVTLTNGDLSLVGRRGQMTITADPRDIVGIQVRQDVEMAEDPDHVPPAAQHVTPEVSEPAAVPRAEAPEVAAAQVATTESAVAEDAAA